MSKLKEQLYLLCWEYIKKREAEIRKIITDAQEAANNDSKSSAGDKFETGREVMQQEIDLNLARLNELNKLKLVLEKILPVQKSATALPGSVVLTNNGNYYITIGAGLLKVDDTVYYAISAASPIGTKLAGKKADDEFTLNGKRYIVERVI
jgi:transcription elongation GreA/GreB family factor